MSVLLLTAAGFTSLRDEARFVLKVEQGRHALVDLEDDAAATPAVATRGTAERPIFFAQERNRSVAALAGLNVDPRFVDKAHNWKEIIAAYANRGARVP